MEYRKELFEALKLSMKEHYPTIFGRIPDNDIQFGFDDDASILMKVYVDETDYDAPYSFKVWKILTRIPLDEKDEWCFETFVEYMDN